MDGEWCAPARLVNAAELLRQPGASRHVAAAVPLAELAVDDRPRLRRRRRAST